MHHGSWSNACAFGIIELDGLCMMKALDRCIYLSLFRENLLEMWIDFLFYFWDVALVHVG